MQSGSKPALINSLAEYLLTDYSFLEDYQIVDTDRANSYSFVARIRNSDQKVRFVKRPYRQELMGRFRTLYGMYRRGIVLVDNMFVLEECEEFYFYVIEAEPEPTVEGRFQTLAHYLHGSGLEMEEKVGILSRVKIMLECLHQQAEPFGGLDPRRIIIDDDKQVYLCPFDLEVQIRKDSYSRAYYPPQMLHRIRLQSKDMVEEDLYKWDIWAFGCICLELLFYSAPVFMSWKVESQLSLINKFDLAKQNVEFSDQGIKNLLLHALNPKQKQRSLSVEPLQPKKSKQIARQASRQAISQLPLSQSNAQRAGVRQLNLHKDKQEGACELVFTMLALERPSFCQELDVTVRIGRKYHFFIEFEEDKQNYVLNRRITTRRSFEEFAEMLAEPVVVEIKEEKKVSEIRVNLQTLVMRHQGRRVWEKQLLGTYSAIDEVFGKVKLKVKSFLDTSQHVFEEEPAYPPLQLPAKIAEKTQNKQSSPPVSPVEPLKDTTNKPAQSAKPKPSKPSEIPTISQISQSIAQLNDHFMQKLTTSKSPAEPDLLQTRLKQLLHLQL